MGMRALPRLLPVIAVVEVRLAQNVTGRLQDLAEGAALLVALVIVVIAAVRRAIAASG
jgi:hypothetical protein